MIKSWLFAKKVRRLRIKNYDLRIKNYNLRMKKVGFI